MKTKKRLSEEIRGLSSMKGLVETYEEMAAFKMQDIRRAIVSSRDYYMGLAKLSEEVGADLNNIKERNDEAVVFLSANEGLYGDILDKVLIDFTEYVKNHPKTNVFVAGTVGESLVSNMFPNIKFTEIPIPDQKNKDLVSQIIKKLINFGKLTLFYGQFESIAYQHSSNKTVSAGELFIKNEVKNNKEQINVMLKYFYEPSVEEISKKFNDQISVGILEQTIEEGKLAQYASRLSHLDTALVNIDRETQKLAKLYKKLNKHINGKKMQLQFLSMKTKKNIQYN